MERSRKFTKNRPAKSKHTMPLDTPIAAAAAPTHTQKLATRRIRLLTYTSAQRVPVAQLDRVLGYGPRGWGFKSLRVRHLTLPILKCLLSLWSLTSLSSLRTPILASATPTANSSPTTASSRPQPSPSLHSRSASFNRSFRRPRTTYHGWDGTKLVLLSASLCRIDRPVLNA
jgi:hypothetical protein